MTQDVVIVGAGLAGLTAALECLEREMRVTVLDRAAPEEIGGLARESFGGLLLVDTPTQARSKLDDSPERAFADWCRFGELGEGPEDALPRAWAQAYCEDSRVWLHDWLRGLKQRFLPLPLWVERDGNSVPRWHVCWGTGQGLVGRILAAIEAHPARGLLTIRHGIYVEGLLTGAGYITGVSGVEEATGTPVEVEAERVVIATGGINGVEEMVRAHWPATAQPVPPQILIGSHRHADGTLHAASAAAGAQVHRLDRHWHYAGGVRHWAPRKPGHGLSTVPSRTALWTDATGARIMPPMVSGFDTSALVAQICAAPGGYGWQVMNRRIALKELAVSGAEMNPALRDNRKLTFLWQTLTGNRWLYDTLTENCVDVITAPDLETLVSRMNAGPDLGHKVETDTLRRALEAHDAQIAKGAESTDPQMQALATLRQWRGDAMRLTKGVPILDPKAGPLVAVRTFPIARKSLGGIVTDLSSRVLTPEGTPLRGLYAVGEAAGFGGGNMNGTRGLEGTFLGGALYSARRLGAGIAGGD